MNRKILIVDDDPVCLVAYKGILREHFEVETAGDANTALDRIRAQGPYAVVISDLYMPEMDGLTFLARVSELSPSTAKIMLTGHANLETAMAAVNDSNVYGFFSKSCDSEALISKVKAAIRYYHETAGKNKTLPKNDFLTKEEIEFLTRK